MSGNKVGDRQGTISKTGKETKDGSKVRKQHPGFLEWTND
jgi:hypothetical protein